MKKIVSVLKYIYYCLFYSTSLQRIRKIDINDEYLIRSLRKIEFSEMLKDHSEVFGCNFTLSKKLLYFLLSSKLCFLLEDKNTKQKLGYMLFLFNINEARLGYIHSDSLFVKTKYANLGYGAILENNVILYLKNNTNLAGIMARVTINNKNAYTLIKYNGFDIIDEYFDDASNEKRVYVRKVFEK